jgi:tetratricopeptide (TPR) repeat protein
MHIGDLYRRVGKFNSARMAYQKGLEKDPNNFEFQARLADVRREMVDVKAAELREQMKKEGENAQLSEEIKALEMESASLALAESVRRVEMHPTDMSLRLDYGRLLVQAGDLNEAIKQFQLARRDARCLRWALIDLGHCYEAKGMFDMAARQYKEALDKLEVMTDEKKEVMYEYAMALEKMGQTEQAHGYYKTLYEEDISFRDVAHRVENYYKKQAAAGSTPADYKENKEEN